MDTFVEWLKIWPDDMSFCAEDLTLYTHANTATGDKLFYWNYGLGGNDYGTFHFLPAGKPRSSAVHVMTNMDGDLSFLILLPGTMRLERSGPRELSSLSCASQELSWPSDADVSVAAASMPGSGCVLPAATTWAGTLIDNCFVAAAVVLSANFVDAVLKQSTSPKDDSLATSPSPLGGGSTLLC